MLYGQLYQGLRGLGITPLQPEITLYHNEDYIETDLDVEVSVPVHPKYLKQELLGRCDHAPQTARPRAGRDRDLRGAV